MSINLGQPYNFEKDKQAPKFTPSNRPPFIKAYAALVKKLCKEGMSKEDAEKKANAQQGSPRDWVHSERILFHNGNIYGGSPPVSSSSSASSSPRYPEPRAGSPYSLNSNNRKSRRSRRSRKSRKTRKATSKNSRKFKKT